MKKNIAHFLSAAFALLAVASLNAQTVTSVTVSKTENYVQTSNTILTTPGNLDTSNAFGPTDFQVTVSGTGLTSSNLTAPVVTLTTGSTYATANPTVHNGGTLTFNSDGIWGYGFNASPSATGQGVAAHAINQSAPTIDTYFSNSTNATTNPFAVKVYSDSSGTTFSTVSLYLNPTAGAYPAIATMSFSQGTWVNGVLQVDPTQSLTITTSTYAAYLNRSAGIGGHMELGLANAATNGVIFDVEKYSDIGPTGFTLDVGGAGNVTGGSISFTLGANTLTAGTNYNGIGLFDRIVGQDTTNLSSSFNIAYYERATTFSISAIPEPSTYAAFAGLGALGLAAWRRRRQRA
jgi:hypothetical protein